MRIGYIHVDYEEWTEGQYNVQEIGLAKAFENLGHETVIVYWVHPKSPKCNTEKKITDKIKKVYLPTLHFRHHVMFNCNHLKQLHLDMIHIQSDNLFYVPEMAAWCRKNKIPYYCYVGTIESSNPVRWQRMLINLITKRNIKAFKKSKVFAKTPAMAKKLESEGVGHVTVAPVGLDLSVIPDITETKLELRRKLNLPQDKMIILCVSALRESRRPLDIFELSDCLNDSCQIVFIGQGPLAEVFNSRRVNYPSMIYINLVPNQGIHQYYRAADYYVNFNDGEIFGMAILEAMYQECTVIARHAPGPDFIIEDGESGYLRDSIQGMVDVIYSEKSLGEQARKRVEENFLWSKTADMVLK